MSHNGLKSVPVVPVAPVAPALDSLHDPHLGTHVLAGLLLHLLLLVLVVHRLVNEGPDLRVIVKRGEEFLRYSRRVSGMPGPNRPSRDTDNGVPAPACSPALSLPTWESWYETASAPSATGQQPSHVGDLQLTSRALELLISAGDDLDD
jgi:hypothetical protein